VKRRVFLGLTGAAGLQSVIASLGRAQSVNGPPKDATAPGELRLAGMSLAELRQRLYDQLFQVLLPFWDKHGIDHQYGGLMCSLDYDGTLLNTGKNLWFLGRAIWVYSFLYNHFGNDPQYLEVAKSSRGKGKSGGPSAATRRECTTSPKASKSTLLPAETTSPVKLPSPS